MNLRRNNNLDSATRTAVIALLLIVALMLALRWLQIV